MADDFDHPPAAAEEIFEAAKRAVSRAGYSFTAHAEAQYLTAPFGHDLVTYTVSVYCGAGYLTVVSELPLKVADDKLDAALRSLNEKNLGIPAGSFQVLSLTSRVQFKLGIPARLHPPADEVIAAAVFAAAMHIDKLIPEALGWLPTRAISPA